MLVGGLGVAKPSGDGSRSAMSRLGGSPITQYADAVEPNAAYNHTMNTNTTNNDHTINTILPIIIIIMIIINQAPGLQTAKGHAVVVFVLSRGGGKARR